MIRQHACVQDCRLSHHSNCNHVDSHRTCSCMVTSDKTAAKPSCARTNLAAHCQSAYSVSVQAAAHPQSAMDSVLARPDAVMQLGTGPENKERQSACAWRLQQHVRPQAAAHSQQTHYTPRLTTPLRSVRQCTKRGQAPNDKNFIHAAGTPQQNA